MMMEVYFWVFLSIFQIVLACFQVEGSMAFYGFAILSNISGATACIIMEIRK
jgi:hypothetical protein